MLDVYIARISSYVAILSYAAGKYDSIYAPNTKLYRNVYGIDQLSNRWCVFPADFIGQGTSGVCNFQED